MEQVAEENLPFILSCSEDSETDELSELLTNKVKSKKKKESLEKSNKESMETHRLKKSPYPTFGDKNYILVWRISIILYFFWCLLLILI